MVAFPAGPVKRTNSRGDCMAETFQALKAHRQEQRAVSFADVMGERDEIKAWCAENRVMLKIHNSGYHWQFLYQRVRIDWWPSTGKAMRTRAIKWRIGETRQKRKMAYGQEWQDIRATIEGELAIKRAPQTEESIHAER